jgi:hypothetical protein
VRRFLSCETHSKEAEPIAGEVVGGFLSCGTVRASHIVVRKRKIALTKLRAASWSALFFAGAQFDPLPALNSRRTNTMFFCQFIGSFGEINLIPRKVTIRPTTGRLLHPVVPSTKQQSELIWRDVPATKLR